jgi:hypothetical protein
MRKSLARSPGATVLPREGFEPLVAQEDVEQFLWDVERELAHVDGDRRRELVQRAEERLQTAANQIAAEKGAESLEWYHYVEATAEVGPPERLAAELTGGELPDREKSHKAMWIGATVLVVAILAMVGYAWFTTGSLEPLGSWSGEPTDLTERRELLFNVSEDADSAFVSFDLRPTTANSSARVTVLDGNLDPVYEDEASVRNPIQTSKFLEGAPGEWRVIVEFESFTGTWNVTAQQERG